MKILNDTLKNLRLRSLRPFRSAQSFFSKSRESAVTARSRQPAYWLKSAGVLNPYSNIQKKM